MSVKGDVSSERLLLSGLAQYGANAYNEIGDIISTNSFLTENNQIIYSCLCKALETVNNIDIPTFLSAATQLNLYEFIKNKQEIEFIHSIFNTPVNFENLRRTAVKVKKLEITKQLQLKLIEASKSLDDITGTENLDSILKVGENAVFDVAFSLSDDSDRPEKLLANAQEYLEFKAKNQSSILGISSGFAIWDEVLGGGFRKGYVDLLCARVKTGKSTILKQVASHVGIKLGIPTLILDTEMQKDDILNKLLASATKTQIKLIETGKFADSIKEGELYQFVENNKNKPIYYKKVAGKPFDEILSIIRRWLTVEVGLEDGVTKNCLIVYDYFKLMDEESLNKMQEYQAIGFQIQKLTNFCNKYQVPCLAAVQTNRDGITKETSDIISQSDRLLWLAASATLFKRKTMEEIIADEPQNGNMKLIPIECRFGPGLDEGDYINMQFDKDISLVRELSTRRQAFKKDVVSESI